MSQIIQEIKPELHSIDSGDTAGITKDKVKYEKILLNVIDWYKLKTKSDAEQLFSLIKKIAPDEELANSIEEAMKSTRKVKIQSADL